MPTITENLEALAQKASNIVTATDAIKEAITTKGGTVSSVDKLDDLPADIATIPNSYTQDDEGKVVSNGELVAQTSAIYTENGTYDTTTKNSVTVDVSSSSGVTLGVGRARTCIQMFNNTWTVKTWSGLTNFYGSGVWTDGENIYYSYETQQYVLNKSTSTWTVKTWSGLTNFYGSGVWTDGENIYYSGTSSTQYVLNKSTSTWSKKVWSGFTNISGSSVWTDRTNIYYSNGSENQYVLNKSTSTWSKKVWSGTNSIYGSLIWSDEEGNIYHSDNRILDISTSTWKSKTWNWLPEFSSDQIWTNGLYIFLSQGSNGQYLLSRSTASWYSKGWLGFNNIDGRYIWTDGENIYYSKETEQYAFTKSPYISLSIPSAQPTKAITAT